MLEIQHGCQVRSKTLLDGVRKQSVVGWVASNGGRAEFSFFIFV